ncbi:TPA: hypothetical protein I9781_003018 [Legionella pneumophila]|uniref:Uncharacterized protein n=1 Tax=Legionella pneumophila TaxID=446 RepID=A0AAN5TAE5_LEGPN|nr:MULTISPECIES: hypothetical protein [Legionella]VEE01505.1 Uncharacterised protein [Legionella oakridgensis]ARB92138.1 hypothetical protein A6J40_08090 [Legionella longbeachae]MCH9142619.1 hypothetical protein [Legionella pneumophila serogroup 1]RZV26148.1 hypothetical protein EKG34_06880 [Legionella longbeachae]TIH05592.1 hypothetical protein DI137_01415 [Legionella pneumophila]
MFKNACTNQENFDFRLKLLNCDFNEEVANQIYSSGCSDALLVMSHGELILDFTRQAESLEKAIKSALSDLDKLGYKAELIEETCRHSSM